MLTRGSTEGCKKMVHKRSREPREGEQRDPVCTPSACLGSVASLHASKSSPVLPPKMVSFIKWR